MNEIKPLLCFIGIILILPWLVGVHSYWLTVCIFIGIHCIVTIGLCLLMGYAGQVSLGHAAFYGIGAYTSGLLTTLYGINPWIAMAAAIAIAGSIALLIGIPTLRLSGHYLAMATLAFSEIVAIAATAEVELTGGPSGFGRIPRLSILGYSLKSDLVYYYFVWAIVTAVLWLAINLIHSRVGRALKSIHGGEMAANTLGIHTSIYKIKIFVCSAALAALAGCLYVHYVTFVSPTVCELKYSVLLVVMVAVGGMHRVWGAIAGAAFLTALPQFLGVFQDFDALAYGLILVTILIVSPRGLVGGFMLLTGAIMRRSSLGEQTV